MKKYVTFLFLISPKVENTFPDLGISKMLIICTLLNYLWLCCDLIDSVPDPEVFGPLGSGLVSQRYRSGSGSFHNPKQK